MNHCKVGEGEQSHRLFMSGAMAEVQLNYTAEDLHLQKGRLLRVVSLFVLF